MNFHVVLKCQQACLLSGFDLRFALERFLASGRVIRVKRLGSHVMWRITIRSVHCCARNARLADLSNTDTRAGATSVAGRPVLSL